MYYQKCKDGYEPWGCCHCKEKCPNGMKDLTTMCMKNSYERATGRYPSCPKGTILDTISQECYNECKQGIPSGDMCWLNCVPGTSPCGGALCLDDSLKCTNDLRKKVVQSLDKIRAQAMDSPEGTMFNAGSNFVDQKLPVCNMGQSIQSGGEMLSMPSFVTAKP